jgi:predicted nucleic acid-binding protein
VAVLDTSVLVRAWLSAAAPPNPSRRAMLLAGLAYDSFTSPAILNEVEEVLARPRFGAEPARVSLWLDAFLRASRQVFPEVIPGRDARAIRGDTADLPVLKTAHAVAAAGEEIGDVLVAARRWWLVSRIGKHSPLCPRLECPWVAIHHSARLPAESLRARRRESVASPDVWRIPAQCTRGNQMDALTARRPTRRLRRAGGGR